MTCYLEMMVGVVECRSGRIVSRAPSDAAHAAWHWQSHLSFMFTGIVRQSCHRSRPCRSV